MKVETDSLAHVDPFKLLARGLPSGKFFMGSQTLAVIAATFADGRIGFYLLADESNDPYGQNTRHTRTQGTLTPSKVSFEGFDGRRVGVARSGGT